MTLTMMAHDLKLKESSGKGFRSKASPATLTIVSFYLQSPSQKAKWSSYFFFL